MSEDEMFADPPEKPSASARRAGKKNDVDFLVLRGVSSLNAYIVRNRAEITLPLLLALQRRFDIPPRKKRVAITRAIWKVAGSPTKNKRVTILAHLRRMPGLVALHEDAHVLFRLRAEKGPTWLQIEEASKAGIGSPDEGEEGEED